MAEQYSLKYPSVVSSLAAFAGVCACKAAGVVVTTELVKANNPLLPAPELHVTSGKVTEKITGSVLVPRFLFRLAKVMYGSTALESTQIDYFLEMADRELGRKERLPELIAELNQHLSLRTVLVGNTASLADAAVLGAIVNNVRWPALSKTPKDFPHVIRWMTFIQADEKSPIGEAAKIWKDSLQQKQAALKESAKKGSFDIDLPGAVDGQLVVRFPPEPSGYLHIGHAKACLLNQHFAKTFNGTLILRFEDTNPSKEKQEFVDNIMFDLETLKVKYVGPTFTSDYFDLCIEYCYQMINEGLAYADDTPVDQMREERGQMKNSACRDNSVEQNLKMWKEMLNGTPKGLECCIRAKINMQSENGCMRDPTIYRCNLTPHQRTGTRFKAYPTYDFACPIVDSIEGVTHTLRTIEYHDRNAQFEWVCDALRIRKSYIWDYSRLNMVNTLMSKRKLQAFVDDKVVEGWFDPRFPTVQGIIRRGLSVEALQEFMVLQGASKNMNFMEWDKIWAINNAILEPKAPRYSAVISQNAVPFHLSNGPVVAEHVVTALHQKNLSVGNKLLTRSNVILIDQDDAKILKEGEELTLMSWGNAIVHKIIKDNAGVITKIEGVLHLEGDFKKTSLKASWVGYDKLPNLVSIKIMEFGHLITCKKVEDDMNIDEFINKDSKKEYNAIGEQSLRSVARGDCIQLQRKGFFRVDQPYISESRPLVLISIPNAKAK
jgi:glutamyl-tRNA synthetase